MIVEKVLTVTRPEAPHAVARGVISKLAIALAMVTAIALGPFRSLNLHRDSHIAWARVARHIQASKGVVYRERVELVSGDDPRETGYRIVYQTACRYRANAYDGAGDLWRTTYVDLEAGTQVELFHDRQEFHCQSLSPYLWPDEVRFVPTQEWFQQLMTGEPERLPSRIIDDTLCNGVEIQNLKLGGRVNLPIEPVAARLWISTATDTPSRLEAEFVEPSHGTAVIDQFQWNVAIPMALFEPKIPSDYRPI